MGAEYTKNQAFIAKVDGNGADLVTDETWQKIMLPRGIECENAYIQLQPSGGVTNYDIDADCSGFLLAPVENPSGPGILKPIEGDFVWRRELKGGILGYLKAPAGFHVIISPYN